jgi:outer membrane murein-binding lipoprotein Lpp
VPFVTLFDDSQANKDRAARANDRVGNWINAKLHRDRAEHHAKFP